MRKDYQEIMDAHQNEHGCRLPCSMVRTDLAHQSSMQSLFLVGSIPWKLLNISSAAWHTGGGTGTGLSKLYLRVAGCGHSGLRKGRWPLLLSSQMQALRADWAPGTKKAGSSPRSKKVLRKLPAPARHNCREH